MRRLNPPQDCLRKAREIERYLRPAALAAIYALLGLGYLVLISLAFVALLYAGILNPTPIIATSAAVIAFVPSIFAFLAHFLRPHDPLSCYISKHVNRWRQPIAVPAEQHTFKARLRNGDDVSVALSFYYPEQCKTIEVRERLVSSVKRSLGRYLLSRATLPTYREIENALDRAVESVADECNIPVLYLEVIGIDRVLSAHSPFQQDSIAAYLGMKTMA
jgi:hypothetical protein